MNICKEIGAAVTFHYLPTDKFTTDYFSVHFSMPLHKETAAGYSLLTKLFKRGCRAYPTQEALAKRLEELYASLLSASVSKQGERQVISLGLDMLSSRFVFDGTPISDEASALLCAVLTDPYLENGAFSASAVEREKLALKDQLHAAINNKNAYALKRCREIMCAEEAYSISLEGSEESIDACTPKMLYGLYLKMLREATVEIFYIGKDSLVAAENRARALVASFGEREPLPLFTEIRERGQAVQRVVEAVDAVQGKLAMGFRTGLTQNASVREKDALLLANLIYGASPVSKLFMNVREKLSLCYYCASRNDAQKGVLFVYSGVENQNADAAEAEILLQLAEIKAGKITEEEMDCAKNSFRDLTRSVADSPFTLEQWYLTRSALKDNRTPQEMNEAIEALTVEDVARAASRITLDTVFFLKAESGKENADAC